MTQILRRTGAVWIKQWKDILKNKTILIQFLMFPLLALAMNQLIKLPDMPHHLFVNLFASMYVGMAPLTCMAAILSEEKEKNTLRMLRMAGLKAGEYLSGTGGCILFFCFLGGIAFGLLGQFQGVRFFLFLLFFLFGCLISILIGSTIGLYAKNQTSATGLIVPVMIVLSFLPMVASFNPKMESWAKYIYSQQINSYLNQAETLQVGAETLLIFFGNLALAILLFLFAYKKSGFSRK